MSKIRWLLYKDRAQTAGVLIGKIQLTIISYMTQTGNTDNFKLVNFSTYT